VGIEPGFDTRKPIKTSAAGTCFLGDAVTIKAG